MAAAAFAYARMDSFRSGERDDRGRASVRAAVQGSNARLGPWAFRSARSDAGPRSHGSWSWYWHDRLAWAVQRFFFPVQYLVYNLLKNQAKRYYD
jgi:hypothetical protein